jgi:hypothetical protein
MTQEELIQKWSFLIEAAKNYWIDSKPTGMNDGEFDKYEKEAALDGLFVRDYVMNKYLQGTRTKNQWIEKIKKFKVTGITMLEAMKQSADELGIPYDKFWTTPKLDGSSIAIYIDPTTGRPLRLVTVGNMNLDNFGVDQTAKLIHHIPKQFPLGIKAIQCEAIIDINRYSGNPDTARQKANGLINSKYCDSEVKSLIMLVAYRYYVDESMPEGQYLKTLPYRTVVESLGVVKSPVDGHITFSHVDTWTLQELISTCPSKFEDGVISLSCGKFGIDGEVCYNDDGVCLRALKFAQAGNMTEAIKTTVRSIQWNDQNIKGKDSWSANVIVDPVTIKGSVVKKPSAGSVSKLIKNNITPGAEVSIILANSTIPMVGDIFSPGNGDYMWPTCNCGYQLSAKDTYGSFIKCGNPLCSERIARMKRSITDKDNINLNTLLVIDRFKWENTDVDINTIKNYVITDNAKGYYDYLIAYLKSDLQRRIFDLVWQASWVVLKELWT